MRMLVVGLGRLGIAISASLLRQGHQVVGVETDRRVIDQIERGLSPFQEPQASALISEGRISGRLNVATRIDLDQADVVFICVGSRGGPDGSLDLSDVTRA